MSIIDQPFNQANIDEVLQTLDSVCVDGTRISFSDLLAKLGFVKADPRLPEAAELRRKYRIATAVIGGMLATNSLPGYSIEQGAYGGIGKVGVHGAKKVAVKRGTKFPDGFLDKMRAAMEELCVNGAIIPRETIAHEMGMPTPKTEYLISQALKEGKAPNFVAKAGRNGGIKRLNEGETSEPAEGNETNLEDIPVDDGWLPANF